MGTIDKSYFSILKNLKIKIRKARIKAIVAVNTGLLDLYWEIGNIISQQQKLEGWGTKVVDNLAQDLKKEFPDFKGLSARNLWYMRSFAEAWPILQPLVAELQYNDKQLVTFVQPLVAQIPWAHHIVLLNKTKAGEERLFYLQKIVENGWSKSVLIAQIESQLHFRQGKAINNFDLTLPKPHSDLARETLKNPYVFDFLGIEEEVQERYLEKALMQHIKKFTLELGRGFAYVGNQYNLTVDNEDYFLDLLFYNYHLHCFVVFELKVNNFKPEYAGKLNFYINIINEKIKGEKDLPTIGILLCKTSSETVVKYSLQNINAPMGIAGYEFTRALPKQLKGGMPTIEELEQELGKELEEFNEQMDPMNTRLKALKERLKGINLEEIPVAVSFPLLQKLYRESLKPLFKEMINKLSVFEEEFYLTSYGWEVNVSIANDMTAFDLLMNDEKSMSNVSEIGFFYDLWGFRKGEVECYNEHLELKLVIETYWYGFILGNYNDQQPFLKKSYNQPLDKKDIQAVSDVMMNKIMDRMEQCLKEMV
jgi:predicted nuclease of restriction endonuclease-like (RecB) superfamily